MENIKETNNIEPKTHIAKYMLFCMIDTILNIYI